MKISIRIVDANTDETLKDLGTSITDNIPRCLDMYRDELDTYHERGINAQLEYDEIVA